MQPDAFLAGDAGSIATARFRKAIRSGGMPLQIAGDPAVFALDSLPGSSAFSWLSKKVRSSASSVVWTSRSNRASSHARSIFR